MTNVAGSSGVMPNRMRSNVSSGARIETYAIPLGAGAGEIVINGAAARHFMPGDRVIIAAFALTDEPVQPKMIVVDAKNQFAVALAQ